MFIKRHTWLDRTFVDVDPVFGSGLWAVVGATLTLISKTRYRIWIDHLLDVCSWERALKDISCIIYGADFSELLSRSRTQTVNCGSGLFWITAQSGGREITDQLEKRNNISLCEPSATRPRLTLRSCSGFFKIKNYHRPLIKRHDADYSTSISSPKKN